jgi:hypothetical protein
MPPSPSTRPSSKYLYHILPYINPLVTDSIDFFDGGNFAAFRDAGHVTRGGVTRSGPRTMTDMQERLKPWMTPLSVMDAQPWRGAGV